MLTIRRIVFTMLLFSVARLYGQVPLGQAMPIYAARTISFETDEGSYMNIDVSPDGKWIAFDLLGDIYKLPVEGGNAIQITRGLPLNLAPVWSKDGRGIFFRSDNSGDFKVHYLDLLNNGAHSVVSDVTNYDPNEHLEGGTFASSLDGLWKALIVDTGGNKALLIKNCKTGVSKIMVPGLLEHPGYRSSVPTPRYSFSPDSKYVFIAYKGKIHRIAVDTGIDEIIPFTAKVNVEVGAFNYHTFSVDHNPFQLRYIRSANVNADGNKIVFQALNAIYVKDSFKGKPKQLAPQPFSQFQPVISPDGKWVAYVTWDDHLGGQLWRVPLNGGKPEQITKSIGQYQHPSWSTDGRFLAVVRGASRFYDRTIAPEGALELIEISSRKVQVIEERIQLWNAISFIDGGKRIAYTPFEKGLSGGVKPKIISRDFKGASLKVEAYGDGYLRDFSQRIISPDGKIQAYCYGEDIFIKRINKATDSSTLFNSGNAGWELRIPRGIDPHFSSNGKTLSWTYGNFFYSIQVAKLPDSGLAVAADSVLLSIEAPSMYGKGSIAFTNARIVTMSGDLVISKGTIIVKDGRIFYVGPGDGVRISKETKVIDATGMTIIPGFVDTHLHMRLPVGLYPQQSWMYLSNLAYGVTTARDPSSTYDSFGYGELLRSGRMLGPRLFTVGKALISELNISSLQEARLAIHKRKLLGAIVVKQYAQPTRLQRQWLSIAAKDAGLNLTNEGMFDPIGQLGMIKDGSTGIEHNPKWGDVYKDVVTLYVKSGIYLTPTLQVQEENYGATARDYFKYNFWRNTDKKLERFTLSNPGQKYPIPNGAETIEMIRATRRLDRDSLIFPIPAEIDNRIRKTGGMVTVGSHGNNQGIGIHNEIWALKIGGLSNLEALQSATILGAKALGVQSDLGSLEAGKIADLIILDKNPLEDIHNTREIKYVMKDGILYDGNTLTKIWPRFNN